jgi:hypothetical protein
MEKEFIVKKKSFLFFHLLALPLLIAAMSVGALAKDIHLQLEANDDPNVAGYRIYYRAGSPDGPFDGIGAAEGRSPIDIGASLDARISGLQGQVYFFAVTAYDAWGDESEFSNIISSHWTPVANFPQNHATVSPKAVDFLWETPPPVDEIISYKLAFTTDPSALHDPLVAQTFQGTALLAGMSILALAGFGMNSRRRMRFFAPLILASFFFLATGCGGDGGDGGHYIPGFEQVPTEFQWDTTKVEVLTDIVETSHTVHNLEPSTTYYWQVVAVHADGIEQGSPVYSFTTEAF